jgi:hypothetical protein
MYVARPPSRGIESRPPGRDNISSRPGQAFLARSGEVDGGSSNDDRSEERGSQAVPKAVSTGPDPRGIDDASYGDEDFGSMDTRSGAWDGDYGDIPRTSTPVIRKPLAYDDDNETEGSFAIDSHPHVPLVPGQGPYTDSGGPSSTYQPAPYAPAAYEPPAAHSTSNYDTLQPQSPPLPPMPFDTNPSALGLHHTTVPPKSLDEKYEPAPYPDDSEASYAPYVPPYMSSQPVSGLTAGYQSRGYEPSSYDPAPPSHIPNSYVPLSNELSDHVTYAPQASQSTAPSHSFNQYDRQTNTSHYGPTSHGSSASKLPAPPVDMYARTASPGYTSEYGTSPPQANYFQSMGPTTTDETYVPQQVLEQRPVSEDPLGRCTLAARNAPLAVFGFGGFVITAFPGSADDEQGRSALGHVRLPSYGYASGRGQLHIKNISDLVAPSALKSNDFTFPGPLVLDSVTPKGGAGDKKKREAVMGYLEARAEEIEKGLPYLKTSASGARREEEGKLVLVRLLMAMLTGDGKLSGRLVDFHY